MHLAFIVHTNPIVNAEIFPSVFSIVLYRHNKNNYENKSHQRNAVQQIYVLL